jgi:NADH-quinone oxidoreductase subunit K
MTGEIERFLAVGAVLFVLGALGFFTRRNLILMVLSAELMLHGVSLTLVTFGRLHNSFEGQSFTIFILTVAGCEAGLALSLILALYQKSKTLDIDFWSDLREADLASPRLAEESEERSFSEPAPPEYPRLTPAGHVPKIGHDRDPRMVDTARSQTAETPLEPPVVREVVKSVTRT